MKTSLYLRLAWDGIRQNRQITLPYLAASSGMVMLFYIITYLCDTFSDGTVSVIMNLGSWVIRAFVLVLFLTINSFMIRRRGREFGVYCVLGMDKRSIFRILLRENILYAIFSLGIGLFFGVLFSKLAELVFFRLMRIPVAYSFVISPAALQQTVLLFAVTFGLLLVVSVARVQLSAPLDLLKSEAAGEKPPRANWILALGGVIALGIAYFIALHFKQPLEALAYFFAAVLLVVFATYLLFIAGSVTLCRVLQANKRYYYHPNHFISVSSMVYRMKRNGAGLASICVLCTMVLVMISSTASLQIGAEDAIRNRYPSDFSVTFTMDDPTLCTDETAAALREVVLAETGEEQTNAAGNYIVSFPVTYEGDGCFSVSSDASADNIGNVGDIDVFSLDDYNRMTGSDLRLAEDEVLLFYYGSTPSAASFDRLTLQNGSAETLSFRVSNGNAMIGNEAFRPKALTIFSYWRMVVPDLNRFAASAQEWASIDPTVFITYVYTFDVTSGTHALALTDTLHTALRRAKNDEVFCQKTGLSHFKMDSRGAYMDDFYHTFGSLFFLGILLSIVFVLAAVLIIYYKQLAEGYEDRSRFAILQKVGMTRDEITRNVRSQILVVFAAPMALAGLHLGFAFPIIYRMLRLFGFTNLRLFLLVTLGCYGIFVLFYAVVYLVTSRVYTRIVSGETE